MAAVTNNNNADNEICSVCLDDKDPLTGDGTEENPGNSTRLNCTHRFHRLCINNWYARIPDYRDRTCPICRAVQLRPPAIAQPVQQAAAPIFDPDFNEYLVGLEAQRQQQPAAAPQQQQPEEEVPPGHVRLPFSGRIVTEEEFAAIRNPNLEPPRGLHV